MSGQRISVIGGGLSGCAAAMAAIACGVEVILYEQRPDRSTPLHTTPDLAELVGLPDLGATRPDRADGLLKHELRAISPALLECAERTSTGDESLTVDRVAMAQQVERRLDAESTIELRREEVRALPEGVVVVAAGPTTWSPLARAIYAAAGRISFSFAYIGRAPLVTGIDEEAGMWAPPYPGADPQLFLPVTEDEATELARRLTEGERDAPPEFSEDTPLADEQSPVERSARDTDELTARHLRGPRGPETDGGLAIALVPDDADRRHWHLPGFVTALSPKAQREALEAVAALRDATIVRPGLVHRLPWLAGGETLQPTLQLSATPRVFVAGTLAGAVGYIEAITTGTLAGINAARLARRQMPSLPDRDSLCGALCRALARVPAGDGAMLRANFGMLPEYPEDRGRSKDERRARQIEAAVAAAGEWAQQAMR